MSECQHNHTEPLVKARGITKRIGGRKVLDGVSLELYPHEIVTLIGPNGSGKTTLLKILLGLESCEAGTVHKASNVKIGYVPQKILFDINLPITVQDYLKLFPSYPSVREEIIVELEIESIRKHHMSGLSGGELQRVMLAQALLGKPDLLVLDEPVQGIDLIGQAALYALVRNISRNRGCAVFMVSHDLHIVMAGTDRVLCLNGHLCCSGFVSLFGPEIAGQVALYVHQHDHQHAISGEVVHAHS
jgi:zinc transport system ATP-binding protein